MNTLAEKCRPKNWEEVIAQDKVVGQIRGLKERGTLGGRAYWLSGASGTGKTTIGLLLAGEIAEPLYVEELDANDATPAALDRIEREGSTLGGMFCAGEKKGRAYIINEAHGLSKAAIRKLLVLLKRIPNHVMWIFTTTNDGQEKLFDDCDDAGPLLSRCMRLELARRDLTKLFAARVQAIAQAEGLDGKPIENYIRLLQTHRNNFRAALQAVEAGAMAD